MTLNLGLSIRNHKSAIRNYKVINSYSMFPSPILYCMFQSGLPESIGMCYFKFIFPGKVVFIMVVANPAARKSRS